jgi:hypothetical protein
LIDEQRSSGTARIALVAGSLVENSSHRARNRASRISRASRSHRSSRVAHRALLDESRSMSPYLWRLLGGERDSSQRVHHGPTRYDLRVTIFFASDLVPRRCADNVSGKLHAFVRVTCLRHPQGRR